MKCHYTTHAHQHGGGGCQEGGPLCDGATLEVTNPICDMMLPESQMSGRDGEEEDPLRHRRTDALAAVLETECGPGAGELGGATGDEDMGQGGGGSVECLLCGERGYDCESDVRGIGTPEGEEETEWGIGPPGWGGRRPGGVGPCGWCGAEKWGIGPPGGSGVQGRRLQGIGPPGVVEDLGVGYRAPWERCGRS